MGAVSGRAACIGFLALVINAIGEKCGAIRGWKLRKGGWYEKNEF